MLTVPEAAARIVAEITPLAPIPHDLLDALGLRIAEDIRSDIALPPWTNSAMDGYAVIGADVQAASAERPVRLPVIETIAAGSFASRALTQGQAMRIMTGAPLPAGADTVIRVEDTDGGTSIVQIRNARDVQRNVRFRGEDVREGDIVLRAGDVMGPAEMGVAASVGTARVRAHPKPRVAILGSGDELVDLDRFDEVRDGKKIISSNSYTLHALVRSAQAIPVPLGIARDTPASMRERLEMATSNHLIVTSAGVSVGEHDYTRQVLEEMGATMKFWRVRMRPGAPVGFGMIRGIPWIGLPGNPVSVMVTFELFVRPAILRMMGHTRAFPRPITVTLAEPVSIGAKLTHFLRAIVEDGPDGTRTARLTGPQGSGILTSMVRANALLIVPEDRPRVEAGETLHALMLRDTHRAEHLEL